MPKDNSNYISESDFYKNVHKFFSSTKTEENKKKKKKTEE